MRALLPMLAACGFPASSTLPAEEEVREAWLSGDAVYLSTDWRWPLDDRSPDAARELRISLSNGTCELLDDRPTAPDPPRVPLVALTHDVRASPTAVIHPIDGALELVHDSGARKRLTLAASTTVQWLLDTTLVVLDDHELVDLDSGRRLRVFGARGSNRPFALGNGRIYVVEEGELVVLDLHLRELAREVPTLTLYSGTSGAVWKQVADDDLGWTPAQTPWAVPILGYRSLAAVPSAWATPSPLPRTWRSPSGATLASLALPGPASTIDGSPLLVGDTWIASAAGKPVARPPGPVLLPVGVREPYALIAGRPYQLTYDHLAHVPRKLGQIAHADAHVVVIMGDTTRVVWVSRDGGPLRGYSIDRCAIR